MPLYYWWGEAVVRKLEGKQMEMMDMISRRWSICRHQALVLYEGKENSRDEAIQILADEFKEGDVPFEYAADRRRSDSDCRRRDTRRSSPSRCRRSTAAE